MARVLVLLLVGASSVEMVGAPRARACAGGSPQAATPESAPVAVGADAPPLVQARTAVGGEYRSMFGAALCCVGDADGDGILDLAIGGPAGPRASAWIVSGSNGKLLRRVGLCADPVGGAGAARASPGWGWGYLFGHALAAAGDLDGDGIPELIVGAPAPGRSSGIVDVVSLRDGSLKFRAIGADSGDRFGDCVASAGDVDGDGVADIAVGAPQGFGWNDKPGYLRVYSGRTDVRLREWRGAIPNGGLGSSACCTGDLDGDGFPDLAVGARGPHSGPQAPGRVHVFSGRCGDTLFELRGTPHGRLFGDSVCSPGDLDEDGTRDVLVSAPLGSAGHQGEVLAFSGRDGRRLYVTPGFASDFLPAYDEPLAVVDDLDGDGLCDVLVGTPIGGMEIEGGCRLISSRTGSALQEYHSPPSPRIGIWNYGTAVSRAGDVDRDGVGDVAVGMGSWTSGADLQCAVVYSGRDGRLLRMYQERDYADESPGGGAALR